MRLIPTVFFYVKSKDDSPGIHWSVSAPLVKWIQIRIRYRFLTSVIIKLSVSTCYIQSQLDTDSVFSATVIPCFLLPHIQIIPFISLQCGIQVLNLGKRLIGSVHSFCRNPYLSRIGISREKVGFLHPSWVHVARQHHTSFINKLTKKSDKKI